MNQRPKALPQGFDEERIRSHIAETHAHFEQLERAWDRLLLEHEGQWVVAYGGAFVFGATLPGVLAAAQGAGWPLDVIAIDRLTRERPRVLL